MTGVPPEAITAAAKALLASPFLRGLDLDGWTKTIATVAVEAAAPAIREAERQRLADRLLYKAARYEQEAAAGTYSIDAAVLRDAAREFADLIGGDGA